MQYQKPRTINADISRENIGSTVEAIQGDGNIRQVLVQLQDNGVNWFPPVGAWAEVKYVKPDGTIGLYDKLADNTPAVSIRGSVATVFLAAQMLTAPGKVEVSITFTNAQLDQVTTFPFFVSVKENIYAGAQKSEDHIKLQWLEKKLNEHMELAKQSGIFDGAQGKAFTYEDFTPEQLAALTGPQGPAGDNTAALQAADAANAAAADANQAAAAARDMVDTVASDIDLLKSGKADKSTIAGIKDKLDVLFKLNVGISYDFFTDSEDGYEKKVPSGCTYAAVETIGGKTVAWNQLIDPSLSAAQSSNNGVTFTRNSDGSYTINGTVTGASNAEFLVNGIRNPYVQGISGHVYLIVGGAGSLRLYFTNKYDSGGGFIFTSDGKQTAVYYMVRGEGTTMNGVTVRPLLFDLTRIFGPGNEPTSTDDPRIVWIQQYAEAHPEYNTGELVSAAVEFVKHNVAAIADIPSDVRELPGYGWSVGDVCNSIELTDTGWQYVQRIGSRAHQDGDTITDGVTTYYVLENPVTTDITDLMADFPTCFEVEGGGILTFENAARLPVLSNIKYLRSLKEVNA